MLERKKEKEKEKTKQEKEAAKTEARCHHAVGAHAPLGHPAARAPLLSQSQQLICPF